MAYSSQSLSASDTVYMLLTDRFFDGDPRNNGVLHQEYRPGNLHYYQGGDWVGLTQKLQYIKIWALLQSGSPPHRRMRRIAAAEMRPDTTAIIPRISIAPTRISAQKKNCVR